ncbi:hypothetical protein [Kineosporia sp. R_H_3]|uniref:hypothetical protein n=1 Tax=Kineosporia sp. R_H_3 TaxID=1961848 RepID=UPI000B4BC200|nr:hypothetical protein [Kineosporia sp. R_H_3]
MPVRVVTTVALLAVAVAVVLVSLVQVRRGRMLFSTEPGLVRDVRDVRRRSTAALVEASGIAVLAVGLLVRERPLVWLGALVTAAGAVLMSIARRGLARRPRR